MSTEQANRMVWDRQRTGHYEVWYTTFNHLPSGTGFWIRYTLEAPLPGHGEAYAQLWFAMFDVNQPQRNVAINRRYPLSEFEATDDPFHITLGAGDLGHGALRGALEGDAHEVSWDIAFKPCLFVHHHLPELVYRSSFADTTVLSPNLMANMNGRVTVDGQDFVLDGSPGCQTHLWGRKHAHAWAWSHCNAFREDPTACLETLSVRLKRFGLVTPPLTFFSLYLGSEVYHFRQFGTLLRTRGAWETGLYRFSGVGNRIKVEGELRCRPEDLVQAPYTDPDGEASFCHNTCVGDALVTVSTRRSAGLRFKRLCRLTSRGNAHFEYASRVSDGRVLRRHITLP